MTSLPQGIHAVLAFDGAADIVCSDEAVLAALSVRCGHEVFPVLPAEARRRIVADLAGPDALGTLRAGVVGGPALNATLNSDARWSVAGGKTLSVWLETAAPGAVLTIAPEGKAGIPAGTQSHRVEVLAAAHRMTGTLTAVALDERGEVLHARARGVRAEHMGGPNAANHMILSSVLPADPRTRAIALRFTVDSVAEAAAQTPAVLFLSQLRIRPHTARLALPPHLAVGQPGAGGIVGRVDLARCGEGPVILALGDGEVALPLPPVVRLTGEIIGGHQVSLRTDTPGPYTLYVDDTFAAAITAGSTPTTISLPATFLDGTERTLAVRDRHGVRTLWQGVAVLSGTRPSYPVLQREAGRPLPMALAGAARYRYAALAAALAAGPTPEEARAIAHAHHVLGLGFEMLEPRDIRPLAFPSFGTSPSGTSPPHLPSSSPPSSNPGETPDVSVVIPAHNKFEVTYHALCALLVARNDASFEVIVVDDGSSDRTTELGTLVSGITVIRNETPQRFIRACNRGVAAARGRYVALLNNDTEPTAGWLDALIDPFERFENVGLTGAKLLDPDGRLQDAGGIVWRSGNPWNYGRGGNPMDPRFSYVREADYLSGAALLTTRTVWDAVGGFSEALEPMYFEDTDLAFKIRAAGYRTMFAPAAVVYHHEGQTSGTDVTTGMKAFQEVNRPKFKTTWAAAFRAFGPEGENPDLEKDRNILGRALFIDYGTPRPDREAGSYAAVEEMKLVQSLGFKVTFLPYNLSRVGHYTADLEAQGIEVLTAPFYMSVHHVLEERGREFDLVYTIRYGVAQSVLGAIRRHAPQAKIMLMNADLHFLREIREAIASGDPQDVAKAEKTRAQELQTMTEVDLTLSYSEVEHHVIASHTFDAAKVAKAPWVVRVREDVPGFEARSGTAFLGGFRHRPNHAAVHWFVAEVVPLLKARGVGGDFNVYGSAMPPDIAALAGEGVNTPGYIEDLDALYGQHRIFLAPLLAGAGVKGKVLGALAAGIPCIVSPVAEEGIGLRHGYDCLIARTPQDWVEAIERLYGDETLWRRLSENGRALVAAQYSFEVGRTLMREAFHAVGIYHTR